MNSEKIVLVSPNMSVDIDFTDKSVSRFIPEGLLYLSTPLIEAGYNVKICDLAKDKLDGFEADVFGITGLPNQFFQIKETIGIIRRNQPGAKIILGGPFVSCAIEWIRDLLDFDLAVIGEAESVIASAVREALKCRGDKKIMKADHPLETADFHRPTFDLVELKWYLSGRHRVLNYSLPYPTVNNVMFSRGCPRSCNFCRQPFGKKVRPLPRGITSFVIRSYAQAGAKSVRFQDDNWQYLGRESRQHVLETLSECGLKTAFNSRVDDFSDEFLKEIFPFGIVKQISFGVESLSPKSLKTMNKGTSVEQIKRAIGLCRDYGIDPIFFIMVGAPGETADSIDTTLRLIEDEKVFTLFTWFLPIPSTSYWDDFLKSHSVIEALKMFDGWDIRQTAANKVFNKITEVPDDRLLGYYSHLKTLQNRFSQGGIK
jgi:radical SAM superfamily enzyme YgiQ (UPF0313 family)